MVDTYICMYYLSCAKKLIWLNIVMKKILIEAYSEKEKVLRLGQVNSTPIFLYNNPHNIQCCFELMCYLLDCIPFWIHHKLHCHQIENESKPHCLKRHGWVELNYHNTFRSWVMYLNHHHKWSRNHNWKNQDVCFSH